MMNDSKDHSPHEQSSLDAQSVVIVAVETILTYIIKNDRVAKRYAQQFEQMGLRVQFNTYYPSVRILASFDRKGLLLDLEEPYSKSTKKPDMIIYVSVMDLVRILVMGDAKTLKKLRIGGKNDLHQDFKAFLASLALPSVLSDWRNFISNSTGQYTEMKTPRPTAQRLMSQIELQRKQIRKMDIKAKGYRNDYLRLKHRHRMMSIVYWLIIVGLGIWIACLYWA